MARILIVDDEKSIRETLKEILEYEGYEIEEAENGELALKQIKKYNYDVVLCDIKMPKMDGMELLGKAGEVAPELPFIMISRHDHNLRQAARDWLRPKLWPSPLACLPSHGRVGLRRAGSCSLEYS